MNQENQQGSIVYLTLVCLVATLGGLLFGYDTAVIAGAIGFLEIHFSLSPEMVGWTAGCALVGCFIGVALAGPVSDRFGRRNTLIISAVLFLISAIGTAVPHTLTTFITFRMIGGLGVGAASMTSPMYIAEISPARIRGRMVSVNQLAIVTGMLVVYFVNYFIGGYGTSINHQTASHLMRHLPPEVVLNQQATRIVEHRIADQIESYRQTVDQNAVKRMAAILDQTLEDLGTDRAKQVSILNNALDLKLKQWDSNAICKAVAIQLSEYGLKINEEDAGALAQQLAEQFNNKLDMTSLARGHMAYLLKKELDAQHPSTPIAPEEIAASLIGPVKGLGATAWNVLYGWRWMFGSEATPAVLLLLLLLFVPESPRWLTRQGRSEQARQILTRVDGPDHARREMAEITDALAHESASLRQLFMPGMKIVLVIGVTLAVLQQVTGINVILYYGPEIFKQTGVTSDVALLWTVIVGACMMLFTLVAIWTVDKVGRKPLMILGAAGMGICLLASGLAFHFQQAGAWVLVFILGYIACFSLSVGPVTWVILSEIFPTKIRGRAMAIATFCLWVANYIVSQTFPMMDKNPWLIEKFHHGFPFWVYAAFCVVLVVFVIRAVPETKGKTLEEIEKRWLRH